MPPAGGYPRPTRMTRHASLTREIDEGPAGPAIGAFFDLDGTLIAGYSASAFLRDRWSNGGMSVRTLGEALVNTVGFQVGQVGFSGLIAATAGWLGGAGLGLALGLALSAAHMIWQVATLDMANPANCLARFRSNKAVGWMVFLGLVADMALAAAGSAP